MGDINFYLKKPEPVSGRSLIIMQWKYKGQRLVFSTGENIDPKDWSVKKQRVKSNAATTKSGKVLVNDLLSKLEEVLMTSYNKELAGNGVPLPETLREHLRSFLNKNLDKQKQPEKTLFGLIDRFISGEIRDKKNNKKTAGTLRTYGIVKNHLEAFNQKHKYNLSFEKINRDFLDRYLNYLENEAHLSKNTIAKNLQILKVFVKTGFDRGYHSNRYYEKISVSWEDAENIALSRKEINKFYKFDFKDNDRLERVRDLFVFGCNVGLRISDMLNVQAHNIIMRDGEKRIRIKTKKMKTEVEIPCNDQVLEIFKKYNDVLPKISDQKFNKYIKEAAKEAGMIETGRMVNTPDKKLYEVIASHTCRRSFCTNLYNEGVPAMTIMKISGHKSESAFLKYIKTSQKDAADQLSAHYAKMKESKLKAV